MLREQAAQLVKRLPCKHEGLSLIPGSHIETTGVVVHTRDSSAEEVEIDSLSSLASLSPLTY